MSCKPCVCYNCREICNRKNDACQTCKAQGDQGWKYCIDSGRLVTTEMMERYYEMCEKETT